MTGAASVRCCWISLSGRRARGPFHAPAKPSRHCSLLLRSRLWGPIRQDVCMLKVGGRSRQSTRCEEEEQLLAACLKNRPRGLYPSVVLALNTGKRSAKLRWLQGKQVDLRAGSIRVGRSKTAAGAGRTIPLQSARAGRDDGLGGELLKSANWDTTFSLRRSAGRMVRRMRSTR